MTEEETKNTPPEREEAKIESAAAKAGQDRYVAMEKAEGVLLPPLKGPIENPFAQPAGSDIQTSPADTTETSPADPGKSPGPADDSGGTTDADK